MSTLARRLTDLGPAALLGETADRRQIESLRSEPEIARRLQSIINDRSESWQARFLASEVLYRYVDMTLQQQCDPASLDESYLEALRHNYTGNGVDWGFTQDANDLGILSRMVLDWNHDGGAFILGLDDDRIVTMNFFHGTPSHIELPYRVKDFAALIVSKARGVNIELSGTPGQRDPSIAKLRNTLSATDG